MNIFERFRKLLVFLPPLCLFLGVESATASNFIGRVFDDFELEDLGHEEKLLRQGNLAADGFVVPDPHGNQKNEFTWKSWLKQMPQEGDEDAADRERTRIRNLGRQSATDKLTVEIDPSARGAESTVVQVDPDELMGDEAGDSSFSMVRMRAIPKHSTSPSSSSAFDNTASSTSGNGDSSLRSQLDTVDISQRSPRIRLQASDAVEDSLSFEAESSTPHGQQGLAGDFITPPSDTNTEALQVAGFVASGTQSAQAPDGAVNCSSSSMNSASQHSGIQMTPAEVAAAKARSLSTHSAGRPLAAPNSSQPLSSAGNSSATFLRSALSTRVGRPPTESQMHHVSAGSVIGPRVASMRSKTATEQLATTPTLTSLSSSIHAPELDSRSLSGALALSVGEPMEKLPAVSGASITSPQPISQTVETIVNKSTKALPGTASNSLPIHWPANGFQRHSLTGCSLVGADMPVVSQPPTLGGRDGGSSVLRPVARNRPLTASARQGKGPTAGDSSKLGGSFRNSGKRPEASCCSSGKPCKCVDSFVQKLKYYHAAAKKRKAANMQQQRQTGIGNKGTSGGCQACGSTAATRNPNATKALLQLARKQALLAQRVAAVEKANEASDLATLRALEKLQTRMNHRAQPPAKLDLTPRTSNTASMISRNP